MLSYSGQHFRKYHFPAARRSRLQRQTLFSLAQSLTAGRCSSSCRWLTSPGQKQGPELRFFPPKHARWRVFTADAPAFKHCNKNLFNAWGLRLYLWFTIALTLAMMRAHHGLLQRQEWCAGNNNCTKQHTLRRYLVKVNLLIQLLTGFSLATEAEFLSFLPI